MSYSKYVWRFIWALCAFVCFNFCIWTFYTKYLFLEQYGQIGDLARLGYIIDSKQTRWQKVDLSRKHISSRDYNGQPIDVITIGDSFSMGGGGGRNPYYQDYISSINNMSVLNLELLRDCGPIETAVVLLNSGYLDVARPKILIIESVERSSIERFTRNINFTETKNLEDLHAFYNKPLVQSNFLQENTFINNGNFKYLYYKVAYLFSDAPTKEVVQKKISKSMFNAVNDKTILFHKSDIDNIGKSNTASIKKLNDNLNSFSEMLLKRGIKLYFMPVVDKYDLYSEYIVNNPFPKSEFFEELRKLPKQYEFIDTKKILGGALAIGEKDTYYADDTHWSWKASQRIFETVTFR